LFGIRNACSPVKGKTALLTSAWKLVVVFSGWN
jgi:hypothetical protein